MSKARSEARRAANSTYWAALRLPRLTSACIDFAVAHFGRRDEPNIRNRLSPAVCPAPLCADLGKKESYWEKWTYREKMTIFYPRTGFVPETARYYRVQITIRDRET
jgi:hypothetical protein